MLDREAKTLETLYQGYFGNKENCEAVAQCIPEASYLIQNPTIVDAGSSQGTLGNYMRERFIQRGSAPRLIMLDSNHIAMNQSSVTAEKIEGDLKENPLANESADIVLLRSVLHYVNKEDQTRILREIHRTLKPYGILISQYVSFATQAQADCFNKLFTFAAGRTIAFCGKDEGITLHKDVFDTILQIAEGPTLFETFDEFFNDRVHASDEQIVGAKQYINEHLNDLGDVMTSKEDPYAWRIPYTIMVCQKT